MSCLPGTVYVVSKFEDGRWREILSTKHETRQAWRPGTIRTEAAETAVEFIRSACGRSRYPRYGRGSGVLLSGQGRQSGLTVPTPHVRSGGRFTRTAAGNYLLGWGMLSGAWSLRVPLAVAGSPDRLSTEHVGLAAAAPFKVLVDALDLGSSAESEGPRTAQHRAGTRCVSTLLDLAQCSLATVRHTPP